MQNHDNNSNKSEAVNLNIQRLQRLIQLYSIAKTRLLYFTCVIVKAA